MLFHFFCLFRCCVNSLNVKMTMVFLFGHELITWLTEFSLFNISTVGTFFNRKFNYIVQVFCYMKLLFRAQPTCIQGHYVYIFQKNNLEIKMKVLNLKLPIVTL